MILKRHKLKFYLLTLLGAIFFSALATGLLISFLKSYNTGYIESKKYSLLIISLVLYLLAFYTVYKYFKNAPIIKISNNKIIINKESFLLSDIKEVELTGKKPFNYIVDFPMESLTIYFNNGEEKYIFDDMYSNSWEIKSFLKQIIIDKNDVYSVSNSNIDNNVFSNEYFETFKGNQFTSMRGISAWGLLSFFVFLYILKDNPSKGSIIFLGTLGLFWFFLNSWLMHYFKVSKNYFIVTNHNFIWKKHIYKISNIEEIVFETQGKQPNCLRVITKDYRTKLYPAGTLRDRNWLELKDNLERKGLKVRNECIY